MKLWFLLVVFLLGVGAGLSMPSVASKYLGSYFPKMMKSSVRQVEGTVVKKQNEPDRVLLTISAQEGAILATFQKKATEISLLVEEGDTVTLDVRVYDPFVTDPPILRVKKPDMESPSYGPLYETDPTNTEPVTELEEPSVLESPTPSASSP